ncbi:PH domain-containing protein [Agromyces sp. Marseille-P2726]|uniref:PH domain-containing protein n=1 Tax=Agromyces sp. Marseille-P2726 TaxID=2709132 RepID=UPI00156D6982|nr:PH domain-containing protein [Agromyces sp. Marseille-P2726]
MSRAARRASGQPAGPPERVVARIRRHARVLTLPTLVLIAVAGGLAYALAVLPELWQRLAIAGAAALLVVFGCLLPFLAWLAGRVTITNRRIIVRSGLFVRMRRELLLSRGYDVAVRRTWVQGAFGSGDVRIDTGAEMPLVLHDVPRPGLVQAAIQELMAESGADWRAADRSIDDGDTIVWGRR